MNVYLNGQFMEEKDAHVSIFDRGFLFADAVYEAISVFDGKLFTATEHLNRLQRSVNALDIAYTVDHNAWQTILTRLTQQLSVPYASIYIQITRGVQHPRAHTYPADLTPTVLAMIYPVSRIEAHQSQQGFAAITHPDERWSRCHIKTTNLLPNILAQQKAKEAGAIEALLIREGFLVEGTCSNVFIVKDGVLKTPPIRPEMLSGVTRHVVLSLCEEHNLPFEETPLSEIQLHEADEIWTTGSTREIIPITTLNNTPVGDGTLGPYWTRLTELYRAQLP